MNKSFIVGRLTKDPELNYTKSELAVCNFTVAVNRTFTNANGEREADFINCVAFRKQAENVKKYVSKGSLIGIDGRIQTRSYDNKEGKKVYVTEVVADYVQFLDTKKEEIGIKPEDIESDPFADFGEEHNSGIEQQELELTDEDLPF